jgi:hypothetical protein
VSAQRSCVAALAFGLALAGCGAAKAPLPPVAAPTIDGVVPPAAATTPGSPELCANATDDNRNGLIDEGCGLTLGSVQFLAGWSAAKADVDLRVMDPNGELIEVGRVARSGLTKDRDCPGRGTECRGRTRQCAWSAPTPRCLWLQHPVHDRATGQCGSQGIHLATVAGVAVGQGPELGRIHGMAAVCSKN